MAADRDYLVAAIGAELGNLDGGALNTAYALLAAVNQDGDSSELRELAAAGHLDQVPAWLSEHGWLTADFELGPVARYALGKTHAEPELDGPLSDTHKMLLGYLGIKS
jgi:hypothetical protein